MRTTLRMDDYMHDKLLLMKNNLGYKSLNELLQIGYIELEKMPYDKNDQYINIEN